MDVNIINPFIHATLNVLETMAFIKSEAQKPWAIPSVVSGKNHELIPVTGGPKIAVPFKTDFGNFTIEVALDE